MPLFILAGELMNRGGATKSLIDLSIALIGRVRGGLGHVNVMTSVFFAGISGSAVADAAALSNTLVPAMRERGYSAEYAGAITAASSIIGPIVPPSIILIFYGALRLCCTNPVRDSLCESSMIAGRHEQLGTHEIQDHELVVIQ